VLVDDVAQVNPTVAVVGAVTDSYRGGGERERARFVLGRFEEEPETTLSLSLCITRFNNSCVSP